MSPAPDRPQTFRRKWIAPLDLPDEATADQLRSIFQAEPRIVEAWVVGSRIMPGDGSAPYESSDIALVLDPPLSEEPQERAAVFSALMENLDANGQGGGTGRAWLFLSPTIIATLHEHGTQIYSRATLGDRSV